jgi:hypothetical protein
MKTMTHYLQKKQKEENDDLLAQEQEVDLEESIICLSINASAISTYYNSQGWEKEEIFPLPLPLPLPLLRGGRAGRSASKCAGRL